MEARGWHLWSQEPCGDATFEVTWGRSPLGGAVETGGSSAPAAPAASAAQTAGTMRPPVSADRRPEHESRSMHFFFDTSQRPTRSEFRVHETPSYFELETRLSNPDLTGVSYFYVIPQSVTSMLVAACWGRELDAVAKLFANPKFGNDLFKVYAETYPIQGQLFRNGFEARYSEGAFLSLTDPGDGEPKWCVVTVVGNIDPNAEPDDSDAADAYGLVGDRRFLADSRMTAAYELVGTKSFLAAQEYATRKISTVNKARLVAKGAWQGYVEGLDTGAKWIKRLGLTS